MRRPETASTQKRNRARLRLKKGPGKRGRGGLRRQISPGSPDAPAESASTAEAAIREPVRCGFGALRVGALLARLRLHLQTDRFLAVHRGDAVWEAGCLQAAIALADVVARMRATELDELLPQNQKPCGAGVERVAR